MPTFGLCQHLLKSPSTLIGGPIHSNLGRKQQMRILSLPFHHRISNGSTIPQEKMCPQCFQVAKIVRPWLTLVYKYMSSSSCVVNLFPTLSRRHHRLTITCQFIPPGSSPPLQKQTQVSKLQVYSLHPHSITMSTQIESRSQLDGLVSTSLL